jgi:hypothetical protein
LTTSTGETDRDLINLANSVADFVVSSSGNLIPQSFGESQ